MKINEIVNKKDEALRKELLELKKRLAEVRFKVSVREERDVKAIKKIKKDIARIMTILREREIIKSEKEIKK